MEERKGCEERGQQGRWVGKMVQGTEDRMGGRARADKGLTTGHTQPPWNKGVSVSLPSLEPFLFIIFPP